MAFYDEIDEVETRNGGGRLNPGNYPSLRIEEVKLTDGHHGERFIVVFTVLGEPTAREEGVAPTPAGSQGTWTARVDGQWKKIGIGEVKGLVLTVLGDDAPDSLKEIVKQAIGPQQILTGKVVSTEAFYHTTKGGNQITKHTWAPATDGAVATAPTTAAAPPPPAAPAAPAADPIAVFKEKGYLQNTNDSTGQWFYNVNDTSDQKTRADLEQMFL